MFDLLLYSLFVLISLILIVNHIGVLIRRRGMLPLTPAALSLAQQKITTTKDARQVAYRLYGKLNNPDATVINVHGSGLEAGFEHSVYAAACEQLNLRGIAISLPGCGLSDEKPGRQVVDWPYEDLHAVLTAEDIDTFYITGHSQGSPHAMAAAWAFPDKVLGLGLNAPLLPSSLVDQLKLDKTNGNGKTPHSQALGKYWMGWYFSLFYLVFKLLPTPMISGVLRKPFPNVQADHDLIQRLHTSLKRSVVRGTSGSTWESAQDSCFEWGFDVRALQHANACVWHADDDNTISSKQGRWLAEHLKAQHLHETEGYGHLTYCRGIYRQAEHSMLAALLKRNE